MSCYQNAFVRFAHVEADESSSLYKQLALAVAEDDELLTLTDSIPDDQPAPNLLFAAVQYLLFDRPDEPLAVAFPSISTGASTLDTDTYEAFRNFCLNGSGESLYCGRMNRERKESEAGNCEILCPKFPASRLAQLRWLKTLSVIGTNPPPLLAAADSPTTPLFRSTVSGFTSRNPIALRSIF